VATAVVAIPLANSASDEATDVSIWTEGCEVCTVEENPRMRGFHGMLLRMAQLKGFMSRPKQFSFLNQVLFQSAYASTVRTCRS